MWAPVRASLPALATLAAVIIVLGVWPSAAAGKLTGEVSEEISLRTSLLVAGQVIANASDAAFGSPDIIRVDLGDDLAIVYCPDGATSTNARPNPATSNACAGAQTFTGARLRVLDGGFIALPGPGGAVTLNTTAGAAAVGGTNMSFNTIAVGAGVYAAGPTDLRADADAYVVRPLGNNATLEVRAQEGFRTFTGRGYTLLVSGSDGAFIETRGAFMGIADGQVNVTRAPLQIAEREIHLDELHLLLSSLVPPEAADRRADLAMAFGPFQVVPAILNGALATRANTTLDGEDLTAFHFWRVDSLLISSNASHYDADAAITYTADEVALITPDGKRPAPPLVLPLLLTMFALSGRYLTPRTAARRAVRLRAGLIGLVAVAITLVLSTALLSATLGVNPLLDATQLGARSRVQLQLLTFGMVAVAWALVGWQTSSLTRSVFATRGRSDAVLVPRLVGLAVATLFMFAADRGLLTAVATIVRL